MFFIYSDTNFLNKSDPYVVAEMNVSRKREGLPGVYGDYNGTISSLCVYMSILGGTPWADVSISIEDARKVCDNYPDFMYVCAAITQNDSSVFDMLGVDDYTSGATGPFTGWKLIVPKVMVEKAIAFCQANAIAIPPVVQMTDWDKLMPEHTKGGLLITPIYYSVVNGIGYVNNCMSNINQKKK